MLLSNADPEGNLPKELYGPMAQIFAPSHWSASMPNDEEC